MVKEVIPKTFIRRNAFGSTLAKSIEIEKIWNM